jgi:MoxR-like ATPase
MSTQNSSVEPDATRVDAALSDLNELDAQVRRAFVGQEQLVRGAVVGLLAKGNLLLEGLPGLGKTHLVKTLARALDLEFSRIQFTPDLMPADVTGAEVLQQDGGLRFRKGPLFANLVLADEINRATPRTQSALLEAMQEHAVTVGGERRLLPQPFFVVATQNPVEMEGTYPLPEAQLDRFLFKLVVPFPTADELKNIAVQTTTGIDAIVDPVLTGERLIELQRLVVEVVAAPHVIEHAAHRVLSTHPDRPEAPEGVRRFVRYGASPRAMQAMLLAGKAHALLNGRPWCSPEDIDAVTPDILRHRLILSFDAELERVGVETVIEEVLTTGAMAAK